MRSFQHISGILHHAHIAEKHLEKEKGGKWINKNKNDSRDENSDWCNGCRKSNAD